MNPTEKKTLEAFEGRLNAITDTDIAWFSGWLCADGCITFIDNGRARPRVKFTICDKDPLERFSALFGCAVSGPNAPSGFGKLPRFCWSIGGHFAVALLRRCRPWLSDRYGAKADRAFTYKTKEHYGRKLTPEQVLEIKHELSKGGRGVNRRMAIKFGISDAMVYAIKSGRAWSGNPKADNVIKLTRVFRRNQITKQPA